MTNPGGEMDLEGIEVLATLEERVAPEHTALLVVDMQNDYCSAGGASDRNGRDLSAAQAIIPTVMGLIEAAREVKVAVIFTKYTVGPGVAGLSGPEILRRGMNFAGLDSTIRGTWGHEIVDDLPCRPEDVVIEKRRLSSFVGTDLDLILRSQGVKTVVVAGVVTQGCVESTVRDAVGRDYYVAIPEDCVASTGDEVHQTSLACMAHFLRYAEAVTTSGRLKAIWAE
jgi:nicotinamidase-related amidase